MNKLIAFVCLACAATSVSAEGYQVNSLSARQGAMGHVGVALKLGSESMHFNPAGLVFMKKPMDMSLGGTAVFSNISYKKDGYRAETDNPVSTPLYVYAGFKIYDNLAAGISFTTPYGSSIAWDKNWAGAHLVQDISLKAYSIQPTLSYKILDNLSVGAGMMIDFGKVELSRALMPMGKLSQMARLIAADFGGIDAMLQQYPQLAPTLEAIGKYDDVAPVSATLTGKSSVRLGYNIGALWDIDEKWTIGVSYRSKINMQVKRGTAELNYANETEFKEKIQNPVNGLLTALGKEDKYKLIIPPLNEGTFQAEMPLPSNFNVGLTFRPSDRWTVSGEVQFVGWGAYKELSIQFTENVLNGYNIQAEKNYKNTRIYRLGGEFKATHRLDLRAGVYFDESPVRSGNYNPETPGMNKLGLSAGFSFRPMEYLSVDVSMLYTQGFSRNGSYTDALNPIPPFEGRYASNAFSPSFGLSFSF